ncbi:hypothetical protein [Bdellovibrio sp. HCB209]|uniref:hypothetical protein n=1 Tax=Bdellovibrio sp. HCB209 TaxID=3394354 RepID=UPI0039B6E7A5
MKKIVSLIVFVAALVWTWNVIHTNEAIGFETHAGIQTKLAELIKATLESKKPNAKDLRIDKLWTESMNDNKVRAVFAYKFSELSEGGDTLEQIIEGEAILHREPTEDKTDKWTLQSVRTTNDIVVFSEGSTVTPDTPTPADATPAASPAATAAPEHH